jgi:hypothetical protein
LVNRCGDKVSNETKVLASASLEVEFDEKEIDD